jgi:predicted SprT family Zn-dependent metalloprotease
LDRFCNYANCDKCLSGLESGARPSPSIRRKRQRDQKNVEKRWVGRTRNWRAIERRAKTTTQYFLLRIESGKHMRFQSRPKPPPEDPLGGYEYHCGGCVTSFFNEKGHQKIQRDGAWCEECKGELILVWQPGDPS